MFNLIKKYINELKVRDKYNLDFDEFVFAPFIKIIVWARRVGKSYYIFQVIKKLLKDKKIKNNEIFYVNKEWIDFEHIKNYNNLNEYFQNWYSNNNINDAFFLAIDEVQEIDEWQKFILSVYSKYPNAIIFITWSNSRLLSQDIWTKLRGRYISKTIRPLTLKEYSFFRNKDIDIALFNEYIQYWWLPAIVNVDNTDLKMEYLRWIYNTIFVRDLIEYFSIRNVLLLKKIHYFLFKEVWNLFNSKNISNFLKNFSVDVSVETIMNYVEYSLNSYLFNEVHRYDIRWKKIFEITNKYFVNDTGLRNSIVWIDLKKDISWILENFVYNHLLSNWYEIYVWILYNKEIDFIAVKWNKKVYIQVCYLLSSQEVIDREFWNLLKIKDWYKKMVLSMDSFFINDYEWVNWENIIEWSKNI